MGLRGQGHWSRQDFEGVCGSDHPIIATMINQVAVNGYLATSRHGPEVASYLAI